MNSIAGATTHIPVNGWSSNQGVGLQPVVNIQINIQLSVYLILKMGVEQRDMPGKLHEHEQPLSCIWPGNSELTELYTYFQCKT